MVLKMRKQMFGGVYAANQMPNPRAASGGAVPIYNPFLFPRGPPIRIPNLPKIPLPLDPATLGALMRAKPPAPLATITGTGGGGKYFDKDTNQLYANKTQLTNVMKARGYSQKFIDAYLKTSRARLSPTQYASLESEGRIVRAPNPNTRQHRIVDFLKEPKKFTKISETLEEASESEEEKELESEPSSRRSSLEEGKEGKEEEPPLHISLEKKPTSKKEAMADLLSNIMAEAETRRAKIAEGRKRPKVKSSFRAPMKKKPSKKETEEEAVKGVLGDIIGNVERAIRQEKYKEKTEDERDVFRKTRSAIKALITKKEKPMSARKMEELHNYPQTPETVALVKAAEADQLKEMLAPIKAMTKKTKEKTRMGKPDVEDLLTKIAEGVSTGATPSRAERAASTRRAAKQKAPSKVDAKATTAKMELKKKRTLTKKPPLRAVGRKAPKPKLQGAGKIKIVL